MDPQQLLLLPSNRVWRTYLGGKTLDIMEGKTSPCDSHFPEDWIASTTRAINKGREHLVDEGLSRIGFENDAPFLKGLFEAYPSECLGEEHVRRYGANTQFLLKFLDSSIRLHIQCHPTIAFAQEYLNSNSGKTEAYVVLGAREDIPDPYIYLGFQKKPDRHNLKRIIEQQDIPALLSHFEKIPVAPGDVFIIPGGLPHAIGEGVFMVEIMEPTDFAVRVEFERGGYRLPVESRFMNQGIDFALDMFDFTAYPVEEIKQRYGIEPAVVRISDSGCEQALISDSNTKCFSVRQFTVNGTWHERVDNAFYVGVVTKGKATLVCGAQRLAVSKGSKFLKPFCVSDFLVESHEGCEILTVWPPR